MRREESVGGKDMLGFRLPPDGCDGFGAPARTDARCFRYPPDLAAGCLATLEGIGGPGPSLMMRAVFAGTEVRQFRELPDLMPGVARQTSVLGVGFDGSYVQGFWTPPDGGRSVLSF